ncbi:ATP synthase F1 subcomplex gamma subunit [Candidatus Koribacter versatilis Ellin345]|uniref:ATP synthase gamma chain n=1 Tax=Koribacter versatilis (strain Ellin345) TaxID=204669 RepID=Q1IIG7_KORVE|nr:ATP synthase F1 subunit gamma [Candidatus Koribacter versatilis]ABF43333.1 ATP synthase F1 subcomplex gamma subunit [Candidatus Koribacter versatilis Ellin345]
MASILDLRRRIRSVKNTRQITRAMKMVSAARLRRAQERALAARPYGQMLTNVLKSLVSRAETIDPETGKAQHPLLEQRDEQNILLVVVTGDRGLAGAFNANITKTALRFMERKFDKNIDIEAVGRKGRDFLRRRYPLGKSEAEQRAGQVQVTAEHVGVLNKVAFEEVQDISESIMGRYERGEVDAVYLIFNEFKSVISQRLVVERILPIQEIGERTIAQADLMSAEDRKKEIHAAKEAGVGMKGQDTSEIDKKAAQFGTSQSDYIYEQPPAELFADLIPKYVTVQIYRSMLESVAAEHAARMTAMDSATNNAGEMIDSYTLQMNRARQAAITKEIIEIVSGAAAL